jgi:hypothetical protein
LIWFEFIADLLVADFDLWRDEEGKPPTSVELEDDAEANGVVGEGFGDELKLLSKGGLDDDVAGRAFGPRSGDPVGLCGMDALGGGLLWADAEDNGGV